MDTTKACCADPTLKPMLVLDAHITWTDAVLRCQHCGKYFLAAMVDMSGQQRLYRLSHLEAGLVEKTLNNVAKGSCDLSRAEQEIQHLASLATTATFVLIMEENGQLTCLDTPQALRLPNTDWRSLPMDGELITRVRRL